MKKLFVIISALFALAACDGINAVDETGVLEEGTKEFKIALTVNRTDAFDKGPGTKATIKDAWADGDVIFLFFTGVYPKYLELKYNSSDRTWTPVPKRGLEASDLIDAGTKTMTAVYLPYGSSTNVVTVMGNNQFNFDPPYYGVYLQASQVPYTYDSDGLKGTLNLAAPIREDGSKYIHFDISGYDAEHVYDLYQDYVSPVQMGGVKVSGNEPFVVNVEGNGKAIWGYIDAANSIISFSGILDANAVGQAKDYQFSINDQTASVLYTRDAGTKTVSDSKYIGIGDISSSTWNATEYVDLGITASDGSRLLWATKNLGATAEKGEGSFGNFYAWSETEGYSLTGTFKNYSSSHSFSEVPEYETDAWGQLPIGNDPAHTALGGLWRTPTWAEFNLLSEQTVHNFDRAMATDVTPEYVDMGNYVGWAKYNVGASSVYDWGDLYAWGETAPKSSTVSKCYTESNYRGDHNLDPATALWGAPWRTPTDEELESLFNGTTGYYTTQWKTNMYSTSGFNGWEVKVTSGPVSFGSTIEFPAAGEGNDKYDYNNGYIYYGNDNPQYRGSWGRYWTSTEYTGYSEKRHKMLMFASDNLILPTTPYPDWYGFSIRPVVDLGSADAGITFQGTTVKGKLFLPAAGYVESDKPQLQGFKAFYWTSNRITSLPDDMGGCYTYSSYYSGTTGEEHALKDGLPIRPVFSLPE